MIKEISNYYLSIFRQTDEIKYSKKSWGKEDWLLGYFKLNLV